MTGIWTPDPSLEDLLQQLADSREEYPADLLAARRAAFKAQIEAHNDPDSVDIPTPPVSEHQDARNSRPEQY